MQLEITLEHKETGIEIGDLGFLLHKHPANLHERELAWGRALIFFSEQNAERTTAILYVDIDPVGLVRGRSAGGLSLLAQYVNDLPYSANSFLSVAIAKSFGQTMSGKSRERQELADCPLDFSLRIVPVAISGGQEIAYRIFGPLGYKVESVQLAKTDFESGRQFYDLKLSGKFRISDILKHLYVLIPVLDNAKHHYVDRDEVDNLLSKGEGWMESHPDRELIAKRSLKHRRSLTNMALARLAELENREEDHEEELQTGKTAVEQELEKPLRLHDIRLDTVAEMIGSMQVRSVLDLGCGDGKLIGRLIKEKGIERIVGVDASISTLERAAEKLYLDRAGEKLRERVSLLQGSLTYGDRRWKGFDVATLIEVIEHIDPSRLPSLERSLFGFAQPGTIIVTTPNREYNTLFETMRENQMRHPDHRFEWTRAEFADWAGRVAETYGYNLEILPLGQEDSVYGAPSQMGVFGK